MMESVNYKVPYYVFIYPPVTFSFLHPNIAPSKLYKRENTQLRFYKVISTPALPYNSEIWTLTARDTYKQNTGSGNAFQSSCQGVHKTRPTPK
jgi:hypothetical protein